MVKFRDDPMLFFSSQSVIAFNGFPMVLPHLDSGGRFPGFQIEWIFYWIESSQIKNFESIFELNFPEKKIIE